MLSNTLKLSLGMLALTATVLTSCSKDEITDNFLVGENESLNTEADLAIEADADDATFQSGGAAPMQAGMEPDCNPLENLPECATVTESGDTYPKTITIDFGSGCEGEHGRTKSGKVIINLTDDLVNEGAIRTVTFENFEINGKAISGTRITANAGTNESGQVVFTKEVNMRISGEKGEGSHTFSGTKTWVSGMDTEACDDNVFYLSGTGTHTRPNGKSGTKIIVEPLLIDRSCKHPSEGVVQMECEKGTVTMDFGDGTCDAEATITKDGETETINLDEHRQRRKGGGQPKI